MQTPLRLFVLDSGWLTSILLALFVIASGWFTEILLVLFVLCYNQWVVPDIDTAHRVPQRNNAGNPKPIVCRFVRRLVKESLMSHRKEISDVTPAAVGLPEGSSLSSARIYDHLSPRMQAVLFQAKKVKGGLHYRGGSRIFFRRGCTRLSLYFNTNKPHSFFLQNASCIRKPQVISRGGRVRTPCTLTLDPPLHCQYSWSKGPVICLRKDSTSWIIKLKSMADLDELKSKLAIEG